MASAQRHYRSVRIRSPVRFDGLLSLKYGEDQLTLNQRVQGSSPCAPTIEP
jgi:hypothetical protein